MTGRRTLAGDLRRLRRRVRLVDVATWVVVVVVVVQLFVWEPVGTR